jgi:hypothetical protein
MILRGIDRVAIGIHFGEKVIKCPRILTVSFIFKFVGIAIPSYSMEKLRNMYYAPQRR